jgi:hypothetical protein
MRILFLLIAIVLFSACGQDYKRLESYSFIAGNYSPEEIDALHEILDFCDRIICESCNGCSPESDQEVILNCYHSFFERLEDSVSLGRGLRFPVSENELTNFLYILDSMIFYDIWGIPCETREAAFGNKVDMEISLEGRYVRFLKRLIQRNLRIYRYTDNCFAAGTCITPHTVAEILENYHLYDLHDEGIRLFICIHYLTLTYQYYTYY